MSNKGGPPNTTLDKPRALRRRRLYLLALSALIFGVLLSESISAWSPQIREKMFEDWDGPYSRPVELTILNAANRAVKFKEKFEAGPDWLRGASFKVKNKSGKEIVYVTLEMHFPDTLYTGNQMLFPVKVGRRPGGRDSLREPLSLKPGGELVIKLDENEYKELSEFIGGRKPLSMSDINTVRVGVGFVVFADGTAWGTGSYYRPDPANPNRYVNVGETPPGD